jgi:hypothetical protein
MHIPEITARVRRAGATLALAAAALAASGCDERLRDVTGPSPDLVPTFSSIQAEIFETTDLAGRTACVTCHTGRIPNISESRISA